MNKQIWQNYLPLPEKLNPSRLSILNRRMQEREESFTSYKISYDLLQEETGVVYLHLNKTKYLNQMVTLIDQNKQTHLIEIDNMEFLIQKKAEVGYALLEKLLKEKQEEEAKQAITSLLNLIVKRAKLGIYDKDMQLFKNFGFIDGKAIEIDIGEFKIATDPIYPKSELDKITWQLLDWAKNHYPQFEEIFKQTIEEVYSGL